MVKDIDMQMRMRLNGARMIATLPLTQRRHNHIK
jgi:hypothetical protein